MQSSVQEFLYVVLPAPEAVPMGGLVTSDTRVTVMVGGALNPHVAAMREEELVETVRAS